MLRLWDFPKSKGPVLTRWYCPSWFMDFLLETIQDQIQLHKSFMVVKWLKKGRKHWSNHKGLLARKCSSSWASDIHCTLIVMGLKILGIRLKIDVLKLLREMKRPLRIVLCKESPYNLINALGPCSVILQPWNFLKLNLPILFVPVRKRKKSQKYFDSSPSN